MQESLPFPSASKTWKSLTAFFVLDTGHVLILACTDGVCSNPGSASAHFSSNARSVPNLQAMYENGSLRFNFQAFGEFGDTWPKLKTVPIELT